MVDILALISSILFTPAFSISYFYETGVSPASPPLTSGSIGVMVEKRRHWSSRGRLVSFSAVCTHGSRLHKIRDRPQLLLGSFFRQSVHTLWT